MVEVRVGGLGRLGVANQARSSSGRVAWSSSGVIASKITASTDPSSQFHHEG